MFDVIWTDPDPELVRKHRERKAKGRRQQDKDKDKDKAKKQSPFSIGRSSLSSADSRFPFLQYHGFKRNGSAVTSSALASQKRTQPVIPTHPAIAATPSFREPDSSGKSVDEILGSQDDLMTPERSRHATDSVFSHCSGSTLGTSHSNAQVLVAELKEILPARLANYDPTRAGSSDLSLNASDSGTCHRATCPRSPKEHAHNKASYNSVLAPKSLSTTARAQGTLHMDSLDAWNPAEQRGVTLESSDHVLSPIDEILPSGNTTSQSLTSASDVESWKLQIQAMSLLSLDDVSSRLRSACGMGSKKDSSTMDKAEAIRWMLWALKNLDAPRTQEEWRAKLDRILVLHESQDMTSYLAAMYSESRVHYLSSEPLPPSFSPNIHPIRVPSSNLSDLPTIDTQYDTVILLSLPAASPIADIPPILARVNNFLRPRGALSLLIIDPLPCAGTLGRHTRFWLHDHLIANLERTLRCTSPSRRFPDWLAEASLRGDGSTITKTRFFANPDSVKRHAEPGECITDPAFMASQNERATKAEIRSLAGRLLWKHIWGPFVTGGKWWWDDPECMFECLELGTTWEYQLIEGVKDGGES